ncbi:MAG: hypothetical protein P4L83_06730, partial [Nevskia sp.]|nr:hypothetical protein [Nevskia sp.]
IGGVKVPVVGEGDMHAYRYLGTGWRPDMNPQTVMEDQLAKGKEVVRRLAPFLGNSTVAADKRIAVVSQMVSGRLLYACEWWAPLVGLENVMVASMQELVDETLGRIMGCKVGRGGVARAVVYTELGVPPIKLILQARVMRVWAHGDVAQTWFGVLKRETEGGWPEGSWFAAAEHMVAEAQQVVGEGVKLDDVEAALFKSWEEDAAQRRAKGARLYCEGGLGETSMGAPGYMWPAAWAKGLRLLTRMRTRGLMVKLCGKEARIVGYRGQNWCWLCGRRDRKDEGPHILLECARMAQERELVLGAAIRMAKGVLRRAGKEVTADNVYILLLGGCTEGGTRLEEWYWRRRPGMAAPGRRWEGHIDWYTQPVNVRVAAFLQVTWPRRQFLLVKARPAVYAEMGVDMTAARRWQADRRRGPREAAAERRELTIEAMWARRHVPARAPAPAEGENAAGGGAAGVGVGSSRGNCCGDSPE